MKAGYVFAIQQNWLSLVLQFMFLPQCYWAYYTIRLSVARYWPEMEACRVDRHRSGQPASRVTGGVEILRPAGQAG